MKKTLYTLNIDNYAPDITVLTYPFLQQYADKICAEFYIINTRKWPNYAPVYEKLQIGQLAKERGDDWAIYIDSDALVHPDFWDPTEFISRDTVCHNGADIASNRWRYDSYFRRDGRHIGSCNWFTIASSWCLDLWHPLDDITYQEALENIFPIKSELDTVITRDHLIDDYILSRNIARYGLKFTTIMRIMNDLGDINSNYLWHQYTISIEEKVKQIKEVLINWKLRKPDEDG